MSKKKNYVTRDTDGTIGLWTGCFDNPIKNKHGEWSIIDQEHWEDMDVLEPCVYKAFIGNLPRKGTCRVFVRGGK